MKRSSSSARFFRSEGVGWVLFLLFLLVVGVFVVGLVDLGAVEIGDEKKIKKK